MNNIAVASASSAPVAARRIRAMIVDDAVVVRGLFARWIGEENDIEVVASLRTGREAVAQIEHVDPDVVVLDVEMPELDGIAALPLLLKKKPDLVVIMASTLTRRNAEISLKALLLGATDYIPKPGGSREVMASADFRRELIEKIRHLGSRAQHFRGLSRLSAATSRIDIAPSLQPSLRADDVGPELLPLRPMPLMPPRVLLVGASTGGPQALNSLVSRIGAVIERVPVLLTQHMPPTFTTILAENLSRLGKHRVREAVHGDEVRPGLVYLAPGGKHMSVERRGGIPVIALDDGPQINFCKPAVDPLFASAAEIWGNRTLALVLTGMGSDGLAGARKIVAKGGHVLAQDETTSVVWGMPGQVAHAGLCSALLPLDEIGYTLTQLFVGERP